MKIEPQEFPTGKKVFPIDNTALQQTVFIALHSDINSSVQHLCNAIRRLTHQYKLDALDSGLYNTYTSTLRRTFANANHLYKYVEAVEDSGYGSVFRCDGLTPLNPIHPDVIYVTNIFKATQYQRTSQYIMLGNLPVIDGLLISASTDSITAYNMPYEGELIKTDKYTAVNKLITTKLADLKAEMELKAIISGGYLDIPDDVRTWCHDKQETTKDMNEIFIRYINGETELKEEIVLARALGIIDSNYINGIGKHGFISTGKKAKFPTGLRTRLFYVAGALTTPDNYQDWFDK